MKKNFQLLLLAFLFFLNSVTTAYSQPNDLNSDSLSKVDRLYLANMSLEKLPEWVFLCKKLKEINLSGNKQLDLVQIFEQLSQFDSLKRITIQNVNQPMPYNMYKVKALEYLDIRSNRLQRLPYSIKYCTYLTGISLDNNKISVDALSYICKSLPKLSWLSLGKNNLDSLPSEICLPSLEILYLYGNSITTLPECLYKSKTLLSIQFTGHVADGETIRPPVDLDIQGIRDKFRKADRRVDVN